MKQIGFIGLGIMGRPMAKNLLKAGYPLVVYNRSRPPMEELIGLGASGSTSPKDVAARTEVVITMVPDSPDVEAVVLGPNGVLEGARSGMILIDMSTISPQVSRRIAKAASEKEVHTLDAPVSGGDKGAIEGTLSIMVGGEPEVFEECLPIFQVLGTKVVHVGGHGMGQTVKLCNQVIGPLTLLAVCEGLLLGARAGADLDRLIEAVSGGAARSWMLENIGPKILDRDFQPGFMIKLMQKDLRLALGLADELKLPLPATSLLHELFRSVEAGGEGESGIQALVKGLERLANFEVRRGVGSNSSP